MHGHKMKQRGTFKKWLGVDHSYFFFLSPVFSCGSTLVWLVYLSYFIKFYIFICNRGILHYSTCLAKAKCHGCHWLPIIIADGFIIQIFPKHAGRSITASSLSYWYSSTFIVRNILSLSGGRILVIKTWPTVEVMEKCSNLNDFYIILNTSFVQFGVGFLCVCVSDR